MRGRCLAPSLVVVSLVVWSAWFLWQGSARIGGERYPCVADDALISLTYAKNAAAGFGLDWSRRGDPVEGFTHPLWLLPLLPLARLEPRPSALAWSLPLLGLLSLLALLWAVDRFARRGLGLDRVARAGALVLVAGHYALDFWALQGMETALQAAVVVLLAELAIAHLREPRGRQGTLGVIGGLGALLRLDTLLAWGAIQLCLARERRLGPPAGWLRGVALLVAPLAAWQVLRLALFGDWLPNTYYLKLAGTDLAARLLRGAWVTGPFLLAHLPLFLLALATLRALARPERRLLSALLALFPAYSIWIGGDAWDEVIEVTANRFQAISLPFAAALAAPALLRLAGSIRKRVATEPLRRLVAPALVALVLGFANGGLPGAGWRAAAARALVVDPPPQCVDAMHVLERVRALGRQLPPTAAVGVAWAGVPAFYSDFRLFDLYGYNDRRIARQPARAGRSAAEWRSFWPGHVKWDAELALEHDRPDAIFQVPSAWGPEAPRRLEAAGYRRRSGFWIRDDAAAAGEPSRRNAGGASSAQGNRGG